ncbi:MAG: DedA family protein [Acidiferrobacter sp.]
MNLSQTVGHYGYAAVFLGSLIEGETALVLGTLAVGKGYLSASGVLVAGFLGGFLGDQVLFFLGRFYGEAILRRFPRLVPPADRAKALLFRFQAPLIIVVRFLYGLRLVGPIAIGMAKVPIRTFLFFNAIGAFLWVLTITSFASAFAVILAWLQAHAFLFKLTALAATMALIAFVYRRMRR